MLKYWMSLLGLVTSLTAATAHASDDDIYLDVGQLKIDTPCAPEVTENRRAAIEYNGAPGYWFHQAVGRCMLTRLSLGPILADRVTLLQKRIRLSDNVLEIRSDIVTASDAARQIAVDNFTTMAKLRREAEESKNDLFAGKPVIWVVVGVGVTIALEVAVIWAIDQAK